MSHKTERTSVITTPLVLSNNNIVTAATQSIMKRTLIFHIVVRGVGRLLKPFIPINSPAKKNTNSTLAETVSKTIL
jgi:hypothetical protein